jgi:RNase P subunit RPR2
VDISYGRSFVYKQGMAKCGICAVPLTGTRHTVELHPGVKQEICHTCHVNLSEKVTAMTIAAATPIEVNGL